MEFFHTFETGLIKPPIKNVSDDMLFRIHFRLISRKTLSVWFLKKRSKGRLVSTITLSSAVDRYVWSLENSGEFLVKSIRQVIDANCFPVIHSATRWVKSVPLKVNIMAWKIKMDGLPTRMNISRRVGSENIILVEWYTWLVSLRLQANLKAVFEGIFYCLWWSVWMFRNKILFEKDTPS
ncbi:hypothetical protein Tco_0256417 [Tanacetum coccineum]